MSASITAAPDPSHPPATRLWLRIAAAHEAALAAAAGFDGVEVTPAVAGPLRAGYDGSLRVRLEALAPGNHPAGANELCLPAETLLAERAHNRLAERSTGPAIIARLATVGATPETIAALAGRADAVTLEVAAGERLFAVLDIGALDSFARACRAAGLRFGVAGNLEAPDVARLLLLDPDHLGFDRAARFGHDPDAPLDPAALTVLRGLVPRRGAAKGHASGAREDMAVDTLYVRDLVLPLSIGAYRSERDAAQRVRFTVEAEVGRSRALPRDMRDIVSYDIIIETIRMLAGRPHIAFVETLAEEIAATLLAQSRIVAVVVAVEKLDIVDGAVGIRIARQRP